VAEYKGQGIDKDEKKPNDDPDKTNGEASIKIEAGGEANDNRLEHGRGGSKF
jgi:hypothetical protein